MSEVFENLEQVSDAVAHMENYLNVVDGVGLLTKVLVNYIIQYIFTYS